jgi:hypothetical protein
VTPYPEPEHRPPSGAFFISRTNAARRSKKNTHFDADLAFVGHSVDSTSAPIRSGSSVSGENVEKGQLET